MWLRTTLELTLTVAAVQALVQGRALVLPVAQVNTAATPEVEQIGRQR
jgi:hypothetical protein